MSPKACAEELGYTFLPCVLAYLHTAPQLVPLGGENSVRAPLSGSVLTNDDVDVVVAPVSGKNYFTQTCFISLRSLFLSLNLSLFFIFCAVQRAGRRGGAVLSSERQDRHCGDRK